LQQQKEKKNKRKRENESNEQKSEKAKKAKKQKGRFQQWLILVLLTEGPERGQTCSPQLTSG
jgi:hypothetical protein